MVRVEPISTVSSPSTVLSRTSRFKKTSRKYLSKFKKTNKKKNIIFPQDDSFNDNFVFVNSWLLKELNKQKIVPEHYKGGLRSLRRKTRLRSKKIIRRSKNKITWKRV